MQVRPGRARCLSLNSGSLELLLGVSLGRLVQTPASSSPISGKLWSQNSPVPPGSQTRSLGCCFFCLNHRSEDG
ncbi:hypothetical protein QBC32DRAFT_335633 [Pseudoneurospora amorphoporcata]|uniref:Uncharacterized protein n=1 Tax=Pseudoneurospora amorphoporcata TaxID=241081 RepID=A0AAN6SIY4_9PEZI|nr:hypothetical protein QBC32DRAFT_335633 [Pseudoneurospora amorphoporcata]